MTERTRRIYQYIADYLAANGYAPSLREMAVGTQTASINTVRCHLERLQEAGLVTWTPGAARTVRVTGVLS